MSAEEFAALRASIRDNGYDASQPITTYQGRILDGRHRHRVARELGISCPSMEYTGDNPVAFVVARNVHRRHLNVVQRAMVAAKLANLRPGRPTGRNPANLPRFSQAEAAAALHVS